MYIASESRYDTIPFNPLVNADQRTFLEAQNGGMQFSHTIGEQLSGQLEAGFRITHIYGDTNESGYLHEKISSVSSLCAW